MNKDYIERIGLYLPKGTIDKLKKKYKKTFPVHHKVKAGTIIKNIILADLQK